MSLIQNNIEQALEHTFNMKRKKPFHNGTVVNHGIEIRGYALASQDCHQLEEFAKSEGFDIKIDFTPNRKWSCLNISKIKVQWSEKVKQISRNGQIYNLIPGKWISEAEFIPDIISTNTRVVIKNTSTSTNPSPDDSRLPGNSILIPFKAYQRTNDISHLVPTVKFGDQKMECYKPQDLQNISINRQGIYINRKYRDKVELTDDNTEYMMVDTYDLTLHYLDNVLTFHIN